MDKLVITTELFEIFDSCIDDIELGMAIRAAFHYGLDKLEEIDWKPLAECDNTAGYILMQLLQKQIDRAKGT